MEIRIIHFYPDLMNLYGSHANVKVLRRYLENMGCTVTVQRLSPGEKEPLISGEGEPDFVFMGAGTERSARAAMEDLARFDTSLKSWARDGIAMLFAGTAMELLGREIREPDGSVYPGIGLAEFVTEHQERGMTGDVYGYTELYPQAMVGFMNKSGLIRGVESPLLTRLKLGWGNEREGGPEGFHQGNVFASELTGPILVKNPRLLETVAAAVLTRRGVRLPDPLPRDTLGWEAYAVTEEQLRLRISEKAP
ncbi:MAG: hypothetical protein K2O06_06495 [Acetatifactor sp.]|nr:hypothetical protein [Acetatifactor sp.]